jgi:hypothetical protein
VRRWEALTALRRGRRGSDRAEEGGGWVGCLIVRRGKGGGGSGHLQSPPNPTTD